MKDPKWLWIAFGATFLLVAGIGFLARPTSPWPELESLHPTEIRQTDADGTETWVFAFRVPPEVVMAKLPLPAHTRPSDYYPIPMGSIPHYALPSGDCFSFGVDDGKGSFPKGITCGVELEKRKRKPWYQNAWMNIRRRLGF